MMSAMSAPTPVDAHEFAELMAPFGLPAGERFAVAVSGGADSLCLTFLLAAWARDHGLELTALTVDHRLRIAARAEAEQVGAWLAAHGIAHQILTWSEGAGTAHGVQARARAARYGLMGRWCRAHGAAQLFTAHHQGDQAETFVMRLKRGSTLFGLAGMSPMRDLDGVTLCRPLLNIPKARLEATLRARGQTWIEDPSNADPAYERVRTRVLIAALSEDGVTPERLARAAQAAQRLGGMIDRAVQAFERTAVTVRADGGVEMDVRAFLSLPQAVAERTLSRMLQALGGQVYPARPAKITRLWRWLHDREAGARTLGGCLVRVRRGAICVTLAPPRRRETHRTGTGRAAVFSAPALAPGGQKPYISGVEHPLSASPNASASGIFATKC